ncbi:MAG: 4Fe-4S dicluster domain-containing protein [Acidobacteriota bacterium]
MMWKNRIQRSMQREGRKMPKLLEMKKSIDEGMKVLLEFLLEKDKVRGIISLKKINGNKGISYSLMTSPEELRDALPLFPLMPANAGKLLSHITLRGALTEPLAVVLKPCELRAFIELVKMEQGSLDNSLFISQTCPGVYPLDTSINGDLEKLVSQYRDESLSAEIIPAIRNACKSCLHFIPQNADIVVSLIGEEKAHEKFKIFLNSEKGEKFTAGLEGEIGEAELETEKIILFKDKREKEKKKLFEEIGGEIQGVEGIIKLFGKCIGCHGCSSVCPICYCNLCFFDSQRNESEPSALDHDLDRKGGLRIPPNTIFYHLGRLSHVSASCIGCGMCEDVCPVNIPLSAIFSKVGESIQKTFDYEPGWDIEEAVPFVTYREDEFKEIGE